MSSNFESKNIINWLCGPMVAVATPFTERFDLDLISLQSNVHFMVDNGVKAGQGTLLVAAAGGEHPTLNVEERKAAMDVTVEAAKGEVPVLASIQHTDTRVILELAKHASEAGIQGMQLSPLYYYPASEGDVIRLFEMVADVSDVNIMVYHTWWDSLNMSLDLLKRLMKIDTVKALKWSAPEDQQYRDGIRALVGDLALVDNSGQHVWAHILGVRAFVTHIGNFWPQYPLEIWQLLQNKEYNRVTERLESFKWKWTKWTSKVMEVTGGEGPFIKAAMEAVGLPAGPPRPASIRPPQNLLDELENLLNSSGVPKVSTGI